MSDEFNFVVTDANGPIEAQQSVVRRHIAEKIDLSAFTAPQFSTRT
jgi:hypothetical protein